MKSFCNSYQFTSCRVGNSLPKRRMVEKKNNPVRVMATCCNTAVENLSIIVENVLLELASGLPSQINDTCHMLEIVDDMNNSNLSSSAILLSFDVVNMFSSIDNNMGIASVRKHFDEREYKDLPTDFVIKTLELCLSFNSFAINNTNYLQTDGTTQDLKCLAIMQI